MKLTYFLNTSASRPIDLQLTVLAFTIITLHYRNMITLLDHNVEIAERFKKYYPGVFESAQNSLFQALCMGVTCIPLYEGHQ